MYHILHTLCRLMYSDADVVSSIDGSQSVPSRDNACTLYYRYENFIISCAIFILHFHCMLSRIKTVGPYWRDTGFNEISFSQQFWVSFAVRRSPFTLIWNVLNSAHFGSLASRFYSMVHMHPYIARTHTHTLSIRLISILQAFHYYHYYHYY